MIVATQHEIVNENTIQVRIVMLFSNSDIDALIENFGDKPNIITRLAMAEIAKKHIETNVQFPVNVITEIFDNALYGALVEATKSDEWERREVDMTDIIADDNGWLDFNPPPDMNFSPN